MQYVGQPVQLSRTPSAVVSHPPAIGEHTDAILKGVGFSEAEIAELKSKKVV